MEWTSDDPAVSELIGIVDGHLAAPRRRWYTLGFALSCRPTLREQLDAIEKLGRSKSRHAFGYLCHIAREETQEEGGQIDRTAFWWRRTFSYPHATPPLKTCLGYSEFGGDDAQAGPARREVTQHRRRAEAKAILQKALAQLAIETAISPDEPQCGT